MVVHMRQLDEKQVRFLTTGDLSVSFTGWMWTGVAVIRYDQLEDLPCPRVKLCSQGSTNLA